MCCNMDENKRFSEDLTVSFIIVNYRTPELVLQCIQSIRQYCHTLPHEIIVVDNHSQDHSIAALSSCTGIQLLQNDANIGFAGANNRGAAVAIGKYFYLLNSDTYLLDDAASVLVDYMEDEKHADVAICGTDLLDADGNKQASYGNFPSVSELLFQFGMGRVFRGYYATHLSQGVVCRFNISQAVDFVSGASMFVRAEIYRQLNGLDEDYFLYFEETDFAFRAQRLGWRTMLLPEVQVVHLEGGSQSAANYFIKLARFTKGKFLFFKKHKSQITIFFVRILLLLRLFLAGLRRWDKQYFRLMCRIAKA